MKSPNSRPLFSQCFRRTAILINKEYPDSWSPSYKEKAHYSLGLFLVQYLCNGFNLADAGIERKYITESMGHSTSHSITDMYIAAYPLDTQFEYNSRLLNLGKKKDTTPTKDRIEKMTEQEAKELLLKLLGTK